jgi:hypothetical protein
MNNTVIRRALGLLVVPALAFGTLAALPTTAAYAATDPAPGAAGSAWLAGQFVDGLVPSPYGGSDIGLTIDAATALVRVGQQPATVTAARDAVAANLESYAGDYTYTSPDPFPSGPDATYAGHSSNAAAKAAVFATTVGADPTSFGGVDLVTRIESFIADSGPYLGRLSDEPTKNGAPDPANDYANVLGQSFAVNALDTAGSPETEEATSVLLAQQCAAGYFTLYFAPLGQGCDDGTASPSVDATAIALTALAGQASDLGIQAAIANAVEWLENHQAANGSFTDGTAGGTANANSTGLAGYALGTSGAPEAAADAAAWVRAHQLTNVANCVYYAPGDTGAIAFDDATRAAAQEGPISAASLDQFRRASAQALSALEFATAASDAQALFTAEYVKAGGKKPVGVVQAAPGEALCAMLGEQSVLGYADVDGDARLPVLIPTKTATSKVRVAHAAGQIGTVSINALGAKRLPVTLKATVRAGARQVVKITGLAPAENVTVIFHGKGVAARQAGANGVVTVRFPVGNKAGKTMVKVVGQFATRTNSKTFTVIR